MEKTAFMNITREHWDSPLSLQNGFPPRHTDLLVLLSFCVAIKYSDKSNLSKKGLIQFTGQGILLVWWERYGSKQVKCGGRSSKMAGHMASTLRKQRGVNACFYSVPFLHL